MSHPLLFRALLLCFVCCSLQGLWGQTLRVRVAPAEKAIAQKLLADFKPTARWAAPDTVLFAATSAAGVRQLWPVLLQYCQGSGHWAASLDSMAWRDSTATAILRLGPVLRWVQLRPDTVVQERWLDAVGFNQRSFRGTPLRHDALLLLQKRLLEYAEERGYPFAAVWLDSLRLDAEGNVSARLRMERGPYISFKALRNKGDLKLPPSFLPQYLGFRPGAPYQRSKILAMEAQLRSLLFVQAAAPPSVSFGGKEATVNLFLNKKKAGRFDFIIGLLPQAQGPSNDARLLLTGTLSTAFQNALGLGERLALDFERLRPETQKLEAQAALPYCLGTPFGAEGKLLIFRRDSTWVDAQGDIGVQYLWPGGNVFRFFWENRSSALQRVDTASVRRTRQLPPNLDYRQNGFGLDANWARLDYRFNPRRGWAVQAKTSAGFHQVRRNNQIESISSSDFNYSNLYDTLTTRNTRFRGEFRGEYYIPIFRRAALKAALRGGGILSRRPVSQNEQYRLGGGNTARLIGLRGFDEESLFATRFAIATFEARLLLGQNSYLSAFTDYGYLENITRNTRSFLRPWGAGAGMNIETKAGIFGISLAAGRRDTGQPMDLRSLKFHIGYVSLF